MGFFMKTFFSQLFKHAIVLFFGLVSVFCVNAMKMTKIVYNKNAFYVLSKTPATNKTLSIMFTEIESETLKEDFEQQKFDNFNNWSDENKKNFVNKTMHNGKKLDIEDIITKHDSKITFYRNDIDDINDIDYNYDSEKFKKTSKVYFKNLLEGIISKDVNESFFDNQKLNCCDRIKIERNSNTLCTWNYTFNILGCIIGGVVFSSAAYFVYTQYLKG